MRLVVLSVIAVSILSLHITKVTWAGTDAEYSGFLTNYDTLRPGPDGGVDEIWKNPDHNLPADFAKYNAIMIDPITIYLADKSKDRGIDTNEIYRLSQELHQALINSVKDRYRVVRAPGPGVLRLIIALTDVEASNPALDMITSVIPMARVFSFAKKQVTGSHSFVGSASIEGVVVDGGSDDILIAFVDHRSGDKGVAGGDDPLEDAREAFQWWSARLRAVLDEAHGN